MTKNQLRKLRNWPQKGDITTDYRTGRDLTGQWKPRPSEDHKPLSGAPRFLTLQWDKSLEPEKDT